jgi:hypothetical protein
MATLKYRRQETTITKENAVSKYPFYTRAYGGFNVDQEQFYLAQIGTPLNKVILDPMGGQGYDLSKLAFHGARVWIGDINPAVLLLATLRDPRIVYNSTELVEWFTKWFAPFRSMKGRVAQLEYVDDWIAPSIRDDLIEYVQMLDLPSKASPFSYKGKFWSAPINVRFAACLPILAARDIACFRGSDNKTWLKKGGLLRESSIYTPVMRALERWYRYAQSIHSSNQVCRKRGGFLSAQRMNVEQGTFGSCPLVDAIITSPPYANRLDYTRMWAPELEVLSAMWEGDSGEVKAQQLGSTVVEGKIVSSEEEGRLPKVVRQSLDEIRADKNWKASASYYYPFFRNYAISLARSLYQMYSKLRGEGTVVIFVRDTVRKDTMFPTAELVRSILIHELKMREVGKERKILRHHVGLLRKGSATGLYGLAQQEWWLAFRKD